MSWWNKKNKESFSEVKDELIANPKKQGPEDVIHDTFVQDMFAHYAELIASYVEMVESQHGDIVRLNNTVALANEALKQSERSMEQQQRIIIYNLKIIASYDDAEVVKEKLIELIKISEGECPNDTVIH